MILAILILTIFGLGFFTILLLGILGIIKAEIAKAVKEINYNTDNGIEQSTTAIFNMESIKAYVEQKGKFEI